MASLLPTNWEVPAVFRSRLGERAGRQRTMVADGHLLLILHKPPRPGDPERESVFFWRSPKGDWRTSERGSGIAALTAHLEEWRDTVDRFEDQMQEPASARNFFSVVQNTTPLLRASRNMHRTLQEAREAFPDDRPILLARDMAVDLERAIDLLHTDAQHGMEYMIAHQAEEQAQQSQQLVLTGHRLNLLVAVFLPLTALGSVFGMNLLHGLEEWKAPWAFWILLIGGLATGLLLLLVLTLSRRSQSDPADDSIKARAPEKLSTADRGEGQ